MCSNHSMERLHIVPLDYENRRNHYWEYTKSQECFLPHALQRYGHRHALAPLHCILHADKWSKQRKTASYVLIDRSEDSPYQIELLHRNWCNFLCIYSFSYHYFRLRLRFPSHPLYYPSIQLTAFLNPSKSSMKPSLIPCAVFPVSFMARIP